MMHATEARSRGGRNNYFVTGSLTENPNRSGNDEELVQLEESDLLEVRELSTEISSIGYHPEPYDARCSSDVEGGSLDCTATLEYVAPSRSINGGRLVLANTENYADSITQDFGGQPIACPSDDGVGWRGALMTASNAKYCAKWSSVIATSGMTECGACNATGCSYGVAHVGYDNYICTKMSVEHPNNAKRNVGVLMMKRIRCSEEHDIIGCQTHKHGRCIRVSSDVWSASNNLQIANYAQEAQLFGAMAEDVLSAENDSESDETLGECDDEDADKASRLMMLF
jgi:hypothetical protein